MISWTLAFGRSRFVLHLIWLTKRYRAAGASWDQRFGFLVAAAFRTALANTVSGQNGFLTAALMGGTLALSRGELAAIARILGYAKTCLDADMLRR
jgi:hypothetical protein